MGGVGHPVVNEVAYTIVHKNQMPGHVRVRDQVLLALILRVEEAGAVLSLVKKKQ